MPYLGNEFSQCLHCDHDRDGVNSVRVSHQLTATAGSGGAAERGMEWPLWVIFLALGGFVGNFTFSVTDHAQNGFYHSSEWIPVCSSGLAVGFMTTLLVTRATRTFLRTCAMLMAFQAAVGLLGFILHLRADIYKVGPSFFDRVVYGAPIFAPLLFPDLVVLACIGLWVLYNRLPKTG